MKTYYISFLFLLIVGPIFAQQTEQPIFAITSVNVIPLNTDKVLKNQTVLIEGSTISDIGNSKNISIPDGATIINGKNKYLIPGMADCHAHLPGNGGTKHNIEDYLMLNLANGVTSLRTMRHESYALELNNMLEAGLIDGPRIYPTGYMFYGRKDTLEENTIRESLEKSKKEGYKFVKFLSAKRMEDYQKIAMLAKEYDIELAGHTPPGGLKQAVSTQMKSVEHITGFSSLKQKDPNNFDIILKQMGEQGMFNCPDILWYKIAMLQEGFEYPKMLKNPHMEYLDPEIVKQWEKLSIEDEKKYGPQGDNTNQDYIDKYKKIIALYQSILPQLQDNGVKLLISASDGFYIVPGFSYVDELLLFKEGGMKNIDILKAACVNPVDFFGELDVAGTITKGKRADLVLLDANPLEDIKNAAKVNGVMLRGKWWSRGELDKRLEAIKNKY